ncbi:unnamed protein product [Meganyctiphanes norvegica]|uniref:Uncharacterized protein n=1 Tax=Meganyctiphanes norvegica TaxID=48144 RepID=A0AAV2SPG7_MEGNR
MAAVLSTQNRLYPTPTRAQTYCETKTEYITTIFTGVHTKLVPITHSIEVPRYFTNTITEPITHTIEVPRFFNHTTTKVVTQTEYVPSTRYPSYPVPPFNYDSPEEFYED